MKKLDNSKDKIRKIVPSTKINDYKLSKLLKHALIVK